MVFRVELDAFPDTVARLLGTKVAAVSSRDGRTIVTAGAPDKGLVVVAVTSKPAADASMTLKESGFEVMPGEWIDEAAFAIDDCDAADSWVVGIAYKSRESTPGLWMDAFPYEPTHSEALKAMYDEFVLNGEVEDVAFEEFLSLAAPNVVLLSPSDVARFARSHEPIALA